MELLNKTKYFLPLVVTIFFFNLTFTQEIEEMKTLRKTYFSIQGDAKKAKIAYQAFISLNDTSASFKAYSGALEAILADNYSNPFTKLNWFNKGKKKVEQAIKSSPKNPELRFIRLSIQSNAPSFLFYYQNINEDKVLILKNLDFFQKIKIKKEVIAFLKKECELTREELLKLK